MSAHSASIKSYVNVFLALLVLLVATVGAAYINLGHFNIWLAMAIASVKATLIVLYFMHVKDSSRWVAIFFGASLYTLFVGALLVFADYMYRA